MKYKLLTALLVVAGAGLGYEVGRREVDRLFSFGERIPASWPSRGQIEAPAGVRVDGLAVIASRGGRIVGQGLAAAGGRFALDVKGEGPFDLQVADLPGARSFGMLPPPEGVRQVGRLVGATRALPQGASGIAVRLSEVPRASIRVRILDDEGRPLVGAIVDVRCMADFLDAVTDDAGEAKFVDLPVRTWTLSARRPQIEFRTVFRRIDMTPDDDVHVVSLPRGIPIRVTLPGPTGPDVELEGADPLVPHVGWVRSWRPTAAGYMEVLVSQDLGSLAITATEVIRTGDRTTVRRPIGRGAVAVASDAVLVLRAPDE